MHANPSLVRGSPLHSDGSKGVAAKRWHYARLQLLFASSAQALAVRCGVCSQRRRLPQLGGQLLTEGGVALRHVPVPDTTKLDSETM